MSSTLTVTDILLDFDKHIMCERVGEGTQNLYQKYRQDILDQLERYFKVNSQGDIKSHLNEGLYKAITNAVPHKEPANGPLRTKDDQEGFDYAVRHYHWRNELIRRAQKYRG